jgi:hypothetical protein
MRPMARPLCSPASVLTLDLVSKAIDEWGFWGGSLLDFERFDEQVVESKEGDSVGDIEP